MTKASPVFLVEVRLRPDFADSEGAGALAQLQGVGLAAAREVRASRVYEIRGLAGTHVQQAARDLLCDPVTQEFKVLSAAQAPVLNGMNHWRVEVWLKPSVTDPVGDTVRQAIADMGLPEPESVRVASVYNIGGKCGRAQLEKTVSRCLANPVIHRVNVSETSA